MSLFSPEGSFEKPATLDAWLYLDEITHRTLNDYTVMLSALRQASRGMSDVAGLRALGAMSKRLEASATAYAALRPPCGAGDCYLDEGLEQLCSSLATSILAERSVGLTLASERIRLGAVRCWQICLIVSELVMNAAKHAFAATAQGEIVVKVCVVGGSIQCAVADNGLGSQVGRPGRGSTIVDALAADLGGFVARNFSSNGATVIACVPYPEVCVS